MTSDPSPTSTDPINTESITLDNQPVPDSPDPQVEAAAPSDPERPSYVKLAMRNMVKKRRQSLVHFSLTTVGLLAVLVGLAYLTR